VSSVESSRLEPPAAGCLRLVLIGDIVGKPGMRIACKSVGWLRRRMHVDTIVANAENAADGSGLRPADYRRLIEQGVDAITLGDHLYRKQEIIEVLQEQSNIVRPANLPPEAPGKQWIQVAARDGQRVAISSLLGRVFMKPVDCPFHAVERVLAEIPADIKIRLIDFHAEATSDKQLLGRYVDGRVSAVLGTHTHVTTADEQVLAGGTGFQCDVGMTGPMNGILGRKFEPVLQATMIGTPAPFQVSTGDVQLHATWVDVATATGRCQAIGRIAVGEWELDDFAAAEAAERADRKKRL
jgi:2',3'-cyclic-nucleotide 2'-phosphodiesterase